MTQSDPAAEALNDALANRLDAARPILIAGPTASGKSGLALRLARESGRRIVNADALQVFDGWRILTARPGISELSRATHVLYGHVAPDQAYSVGQWLRDMAPELDQHPAPIIVGGTGLYFAALVQGLAEIPATDPMVREKATEKRASDGLQALIGELDPDTRAQIDLQNPMRVQRAWEVQHQTGRGIAAWQADTPAPLLPLSSSVPFLLQAEGDWFEERIAARFEHMLEDGLLDEAREMSERWDPDTLAAQAIGARDLIAHVTGNQDLETARRAVILATRQYAKRQRTWFRSRMGDWNRLNAKGLTLD